MNDSHPDIDLLIASYLCHQASAQEREALEKWLDASVENREVFLHLQKVWNSSAESHLTPKMIQSREKIWQQAEVQGAKAKKISAAKNIDLNYWSKAAAIFIFCLIGAGLFSYLVINSVPEPQTVSVIWHEIENPNGTKSIHTLPDGTKVWLNAASNLSYPEKFSDTLRIAKLRGEAFFEVAEDKKKPFVVEASGTQTRVLGTTFNISDYPEEDSVKISLLEGKVRVLSSDKFQTVLLSPGEELIASRDNTRFFRRPFDYINTFGWKEGTLIFDGADFESFRQIIERWYGVKVTYEGKTPTDWEIRARYYNESLTHVLRDISFNKNIKFTQTKDQVLLTF